MSKSNLKEKIRETAISFSPTERKLVSILAGWTFIHLIIFVFTSPYGISGSPSYLWPFDSREASIGAHYDITEFLIYAGTPWVMFFIFRKIKRYSLQGNN